jgi:glucose uptake protein GlcU
MNRQIRTVVFNFSALLVLAGAVLYFVGAVAAPYLFAFGAAGIAVCHLTLPVKGMDFRERRLQIFNVISGLLMVVASVFMFRRRNEWILCLTVAALLQLYTVFAPFRTAQGRARNKNKLRQ